MKLKIARLFLTMYLTLRLAKAIRQLIPDTLTTGGEPVSIRQLEYGSTCTRNYKRSGHSMIAAPVRLSANGEHGFPTISNESCVRLTINGDSRRLVIAYDMEEGWVESYCVDDQGDLLIRNNEYVCKREYGSVVATILL